MGVCGGRGTHCPATLKPQLPKPPSHHTQGLARAIARFPDQHLGQFHPLPADTRAASQAQPLLVPPTSPAASSAVTPHSLGSSPVSLVSIPQTRQALPHLGAPLVPCPGSFCFNITFSGRGNPNVVQMTSPYTPFLHSTKCGGNDNGYLCDY